MEKFLRKSDIRKNNFGKLFLPTPWPDQSNCGEFRRVRLVHISSEPHTPRYIFRSGAVLGWAGFWENIFGMYFRTPLESFWWCLTTLKCPKCRKGFPPRFGQLSRPKVWRGWILGYIPTGCLGELHKRAQNDQKIDKKTVKFWKPPVQKFLKPRCYRTNGILYIRVHRHCKKI